MNWIIRIRPRAEQDLAAAREWYEQQRVGLGDEFLDAAAGAFLTLESAPERERLYYLNFRRIICKRRPGCLVDGSQRREFFRKRRPGCLVDGSQRREFFRRISRKYGNYDVVVARGFQSEGNSGRKSSDVVIAGKRPRRSRR
jgi:hypothetical protein